MPVFGVNKRVLQKDIIVVLEHISKLLSDERKAHRWCA